MCWVVCARAHMGVIAETKTTLEVYDLHCSNDVFLLGPKDLSDLLQAVIQRQWWGAFSELASMQQWTDLGIPFAHAPTLLLLHSKESYQSNPCLQLISSFKQNTVGMHRNRITCWLKYTICLSLPLLIIVTIR